jgi:uncharacterized protein (TIGR04255 family)
MAESRHYARPPITEAVIELRFEGVLSARDMERVRDRFKSRYTTIEQIQMLEVMFGEAGTAAPKLVAAGFKMTDKNAVNILMLKPVSFGTIRLAPYETWDKLISRAKENWELFEKALNTKKRVVRIGARFINRIDIPTALFSSMSIEEFFPTHIRLGTDIASDMGNFSFQVAALHAGTGVKLTIQSGVLEQAALLEHTSISLDTDAYWDVDIPLRIDDMWARADKLREAKNSVFENSISDRLRDLFK